MIIGVFGKPRSGKSTFLARKVAFAQVKRTLAHKTLPFLHNFIPHPDVIYALDPSFKGCTIIDRYDVGAFDPSVEGRSLFVLNEAGVNYNNKDFKSLPKHVRDFWADHGHYNAYIIWDSQTVNVNKELRERTDHYYVVKKKGGKSRVTRINFDIGCNAENIDIVERYSEPRSLFEKILWKLLHWDYSFRRSHYYKCFNSHVKRLDFLASAPPNVTAYRKPSFLFKVAAVNFLWFVGFIIAFCCILEYGFGLGV